MRDDLVDIHVEAGLEYDEAFNWYLQRSEDAALDFDREVDGAFAEIAQEPERWALGSYSCRRFLLQKFPYSVIYRERPPAEFRLSPSLTPAEGRDSGSIGSNLLPALYARLRRMVSSVPSPR